VVFRIAGMYIISLLIVGLIVPNGSVDLLSASGANTKASPFVLAIQYAGVQGLPSVFNVVICLSVLSVANACTYGSTRTLQALAADGMGPKFLAYVDKKGRPLWPIIIQILFGFLAFANLATTGQTVLYWLLAISGLTCFVGILKEIDETNFTDIVAVHLGNYLSLSYTISRRLGACRSFAGSATLPLSCWYLWLICWLGGGIHLLVGNVLCCTLPAWW
jgi:amino acid permease